jgi:hypothetical protein
VRFFTAHGKKASNGAGMKRRVTPFAVRQEKTHDKDGIFAVRWGKKRTTNIVETVRKCLSCAVRKTHGKERLCRAPDKKRTANIITHGKKKHLTAPG